jgi:nucleotide-binding universal stress UspA family protein
VNNSSEYQLKKVIMKKQILIAIDDSATSAQALDYISHLFSAHEDVHFIIQNCTGCGAEVLPEPEDSRNSLTPDRPLGKRHHNAQKLLERARAKLESLGITNDRISCSSLSASSVALAIQQYAEKHLVDSIVMARRGVGIVGELLLGSVSSSLFDKCRSIPLWILDGSITSNKFLVPVDGTPSSLMAVDHLAHIFQGRSDVIFYLFHARGFLSSPPVCKPENFYDKWGKEWCDINLSGNGCMFTGPTEILTAAGIPKECIVSLPQPTAIEESTAIISSARKNHCGTIVIGRRPGNANKGILGGVSKRTILQTENLALWVIG